MGCAHLWGQLEKIFNICCTHLCNICLTHLHVIFILDWLSSKTEAKLGTMLFSVPSNKINFSMCKIFPISGSNVSDYSNSFCTIPFLFCLHLFQFGEELMSIVVQTIQILSRTWTLTPPKIHAEERHILILVDSIQLTLPGIGSHAIRRKNAFTAATGATSTRIQSVSIWIKVRWLEKMRKGV